MKKKIKQAASVYTAKQGGILSEKVANAFIAGANFGRDIGWIKYNEQKPEIGQLVLVYRDIECKQIYSTVWSDEDEMFADWNEITHWMPLEYPSA